MTLLINYLISSCLALLLCSPSTAAAAPRIGWEFTIWFVISCLTGSRKLSGKFDP